MITKENIDSLLSDDITKKEYDRLIELINQRVDEIWKYILKVSNRKFGWYSFSNDHEYDNGNGSDGGYFDPKEDSEYITLIGDFNSFRGISEFYDYHNGFPTELLWKTDWKEIIDHETSEAIRKDEEKKILEKSKILEKKERKEKLIESIKNKLTKEELSVIKFK